MRSVFPVKQIDWRAQYPSHAEIANSKIMARSTLHIPNRQGVTIVAAFELSYYYAYWFVFTAKSARTPRRLWKRVEVITLYQGKIMTMDEIITRVTFGKPDVKITRRFTAGKKNFASSLDHTAHPTRNTPAPVGISPRNVEYYNRRHSANRSRWGR